MAKKKSVKKWFKYCKSVLWRYLPLIIWILFTSFVFWNTYRQMKTKPQYYYLRSILGGWLCLSRGTAPVLTTCSVLILLPICRSIHTFIHYAFAKVSFSLLTCWIANVKTMHMSVAATLITFSLVHSGAHVMNILNFSKHYTETYPEINLAKYKGQNPAMLICTWTGYSGILMLFILLIITITSTSSFRSKHFNTFYITHHLFLVYLLLLFTHPFSGVLKEQSNIGQHEPGCVMANGTVSERKGYPVYCRSPPKFKCMSTQGWLWVLVALSIYTFEITYRKYKNFNMEAISAYYLNKTINLKLKCPLDFKIDCGQYVLIQNSKISRIEWHPFTVTKCPTKENHTFELLISIRGDWTKKLSNLIKNPFVFNQNESYICRLYHEPLKFLVDGPFSSPMQEIKNKKYVICVAAGVGITSFVATLQYLLVTTTKSPKRMHLLWMTRDPNQLLWYSKLLCDLQNKFWENNEPDRLQIQIFVTSKKELVDTIFKNHKLRSRIKTKRPNWKEQFRIFHLFYGKQEVNLFCCGPKTLSKELRKRCFTNNKKGGNIIFIKEGF